MATSVKDFFQQNPRYIGSANTANRTTNQVVQPKKQKGKGGFLSSIISELSGAGGAAGGAALGASLGSVVPGIGTLIGGGLGAAIGGFGGGFGGRLAENKFRDNEYRAGDALKEGALSGAFGVAGTAFQGARGLKAVGGLRGLKAATAVGGDDALKAGAKSILTGGKKAGMGLAGTASDDAANLLTKAGGSLRQNVVNPKTKASIFGAADDKAISETVNKYVKGMSASGKYKNLGPAVTNISDDITKELSKVTTKADVAQLTKTITQNLADDIRYVPGDAAYESELKRVLTKLSGTAKNGKLDPTDVFKFKQYLGSQLQGAFGKSGADLTIPQQVRMAVWDNMDDVISNIPKVGANVKNMTVAQSRLIQSAKGLKQAADKTAGVPMLGLKSKGLESGIQGAQELGGRALGVAGGLQSGVTGVGGGLGSRLAKGTLARGIGNRYVNPSAPEEDPSLQLGATEGQEGLVDPMGDLGGAPAEVPQSQPSYTLEQAIADIQQYPDQRKEIQDYYKFVQDAQKAQGGGNGLNVGKVSAQQYQLSQQGLNSLGKFAQLIQKDPGVINRSNTPGRGLPVVGGYVTKAAGTGQYDTLGFAAINSLLRAQSGAAVPDSEVRAYMKAYLPRAGDDEETIQQKLETLQYAFQTILSGAGGEESPQEPQYQL